MGQTISYTQKEDGFFYGTYDEMSQPFGSPKKNVPFGPAYKIIAPGGIPDMTIYDIKDNAIFVEFQDKNFVTGKKVSEEAKEVLNRMIFVLYSLSTSPRGLVKKDDANLQKIEDYSAKMTVPDSFCLDVTPCIPEFKCCNTWITKTFGPNGLIILAFIAAIFILTISSSSALSLILITK